MQVTVKAILDKRGSETQTMNHFTFANSAGTIKGGCYIDKKVSGVKELVLSITNGDDDNA